MNIGHVLRRCRSGPVGLILSVLVAPTAFLIVARTVDRDLLGRAFAQALDDPATVGIAMGAFAFAFVLRAIAWQRVLPDLAFGQALGGIHVALGANHVLPLRLGEPFRVVSVTRRAGIGAEAALASTVSLRAADVLAMAAIGLAISPALFADLLGSFVWLALAVVCSIAAYAWLRLRRLAAASNRLSRVRLPGVLVFGLAAAAWLAEAVVVWQAARWAGLDIAWSDAALITTVSVGAQIAAIAPGGFGTYEAAAVAAYVALGYDPRPALVAALGAHAVKTAYSLVAGGLALFVPAPGLLGRFRLAPATVSSPSLPPPASMDDAPILLFMPAFNEEASVGSCIARAPSTVCGRAVEVLVIDDGSSDATAERARASGADVISLVGNQGLGAAVRIGLTVGAERGAAVTVFCDADGEYPPEELGTLVRPILAGEADYVTGSRFLGRIDHMRPHRRFGNVVLTAALSVVARRRITDGQTGYRAFSPQAAAAAEIVHDFNYAQVLTLDLLAKGFDMHEVPISYRFRVEGESFVTLGRYLRNVVPAVYRELNTG